VSGPKLVPRKKTLPPGSRGQRPARNHSYPASHNGITGAGRRRAGTVCAGEVQHGNRTARAG
jgi:hypothetical protein